MPWTIVVHGGAGSAEDEIDSPERMGVLRAAVDVGQWCLRQGGSALDAVQLAVEKMEESPLFNAGRGSAYHALGGHEMDAAIMGGDHRCGAVAGLRRTKHPIAVARHVLEESPHVFFSAAGAERVARQAGVEEAPEEYFATGLRRTQLYRELAKQQQVGTQDEQHNRSNGTVGAVALDTAGHLAAATSTGGMTAKPPGRIGDTPVIGAGTYASDTTCAVSGTGNGELFLANSVAATISTCVDLGLSLHDAAARVVNKLPKASGGVIAVDTHGNWTAPFNSDVLFRGIASSEDDGIKLAVRPGSLGNKARL